MEIHEKIKKARELNSWSQEDMAEKLGMSPAGYAKIERGKTKLNFDKLEKIANIFKIDIAEFISAQEKGLVLLISDSGDHGTSKNYYGVDETILAENEKLKLIIEHKNELLSQTKLLLQQKDGEIATLKELVAILKQKTD